MIARHLRLDALILVVALAGAYLALPAPRPSALAIPAAPSGGREQAPVPTTGALDSTTDEQTTAATTPPGPRPTAGARKASPAPLHTPKPTPTRAPRPATRPSGATIRVGLASTYGPRFSEWWVALPDGPGWRFRVCGPGGCRTLVSTDAGPDRAMQRIGRIVDLPVHAFESVCGVPWTYGLCNVSVTILGSAG